ncbi:MAG: hypothetical protein V3V32_04090, partial [Dehalococcoidia bacterium]
WFHVVASLSVIALIGLLGVGLLLFLAPFLWLAHGLLLAQPAFGWQVLVMLQVAILYMARFLVSRRFSQPKSSVILHPIGVAFLLLVCLYASYRHLRGAGIRWKGRVYGPESQIG